jgi:hypothetical protein
MASFSKKETREKRKEERGKRGGEKRAPFLHLFLASRLSSLFSRL